MQERVISWLTSLPLQEYDFVLNKEEFVDVMCIRYLHPLKNMPKKCACGTNNSPDHALICMKGGYVAMRHNQIRDLIINFLIKSGCKDIVREPHLLPLTGETFTLRSVNTSQEARLDIAVRVSTTALKKPSVMSECFTQVHYQTSVKL